MPGKEDASLNAGVLDERKPKMKVSDGRNQTAKLLDPQLLDKPAQVIGFLDEEILMIAVLHASWIQDVKVGNKLELVAQLPHLVRLYQSRRSLQEWA